MGRRPLPTALHQLHGNPGKRRRNRDEPRPRVDPNPVPPDYLPPDARAKWDELVPLLLRLGLLTVVDHTALALYCSAYARFLEAERKINELGEVIIDKRGVARRSPWLLLQRTATRQMVTIGGQFGMTPADRARLLGGGGG